MAATNRHVEIYKNETTGEWGWRVKRSGKIITGAFGLNAKASALKVCVHTFALNERQARHLSAYGNVMVEMTNPPMDEKTQAVKLGKLFAPEPTPTDLRK